MNKKILLVFLFLLSISCNEDKSIKNIDDHYLEDGEFILNHIKAQNNKLSFDLTEKQFIDSGISEDFFLNQKQSIENVNKMVDSVDWNLNYSLILWKLGIKKIKKERLFGNKESFYSLLLISDSTRYDKKEFLYMDSLFKKHISFQNNLMTLKNRDSLKLLIPDVNITNIQNKIDSINGIIRIGGASNSNEVINGFDQGISR